MGAVICRCMIKTTESSECPTESAVFRHPVWWLQRVVVVDEGQAVGGDARQQLAGNTTHTHTHTHTAHIKQLSFVEMRREFLT
jgi:hypothetical protein